MRLLSPQNKEMRIDDCFAANITSEHPPPHVPPRLPSRPPTASPRVRISTPPHRPATAPGPSPQHRAAPSYSQPTKASSSAVRAVVEMDGHLMRRGKRMEQLFRHADRDRTGTLDAAQVRTLLRSAKLPERLAQGFMEQVQGSNEPEPMNDGATKVSLDAYEGKVSLDAFSNPHPRPNPNPLSLP